ncbi:G-patch domain [Macleaya cordata]|uniref:G-patch domain n=1 Tax=Macleaya cordata TaxID=56857 RepID=A0A200PYA5_MACCD|nr:G-patch domain [Macleaya cordata]
MGLNDDNMAFQEGTTRMVKGFDNGKRKAVEEFTTKIQTGWVHTKAQFLLHQHNVVASTVHQKIKFSYQGRIVVIYGGTDGAEEIANVNGKNIVPMIEPDKPLCNFADEAISLLEVRPIPYEKLPSRFDHRNRKIAYLMRTHKYFPGMGLGKSQQGKAKPFESRAVALKETFGLGYRPTKAEILKSSIEEGKKAQARGKGDFHATPSID